jgi:NADH dehydrogenase [ubiquinone] 1 alpha subcomplex assembly factor 7
MTQPQHYDAEARRETPLALKLKARILREGPITVRDYMQACLHDADHGYYKTQAAIGAAGDFITAPEISQTFGELIGLWCAAVWQQMGEPASITLVEYGPGRGTLMHDALRAIRIVPQLAKAINVICIESNPILAARQRDRLAGTGYSVTWQPDDATVRAAIAANATPHILLGNEFLDTLNIDQSERVTGAWLERRVGLDAAGRLTFMATSVAHAGPAPLARLAAEASDGAISERADYARVLWSPPQTPTPTLVAALYIDYGHANSALGDSLQAVRQHAFEHPLCSPGEADLSAQVDFEAFAAQARQHQLCVDGPVTQTEFLGSLGIMERASRLIAANPAKANELETGVARLMAPNGMGTRFKVIGVRSRELPNLPGFPVATPTPQ